MPNKSPSTKVNLGHLAIGAVPTIAAGLLVLWHGLRPIVTHEQQGILLALAGWLVCGSLAVWTWCVVHAVGERFEDRDRAADARQESMQQQGSENHAEVMKELRRQGNAIQALHGRLEKMEQRACQLSVRLANAEVETAHLRGLVLGDAQDEVGGASVPTLRSVR
jgi:hypothetical protein